MLNNFNDALMSIGFKILMALYLSITGIMLPLSTIMVSIVDPVIATQISKMPATSLIVLFALLILAGLVILDKRLRSSSSEKKELYKNIIDQKDKIIHDQAQRIKDLEHKI
jgi:membrane protein implicated in regulation of membrane protease activity